MSRVFPLLLACAVAASACGRSPTGPTDAGRTARLQRTRFLAFGDSLTAGDPANPNTQYSSILERLLESRYVSQASEITVVNAGVGGERLVGGVLRFDEVLDEQRPEVVLLWEGINDIVSLGPEASATLLQSMTQRAMSRNMRVFVASMLPTIPGRLRSHPEPLLLDLNARVRAMAAQQGAVYVDLYNSMLPEVETLISSDGLHPTEPGYQRIAEVFLEAIRGTLESR